jgi:hypothetical protein
MRGHRPWVEREHGSTSPLKRSVNHDYRLCDALIAALAKTLDIPERAAHDTALVRPRALAGRSASGFISTEATRAP